MGYMQRIKNYGLLKPLTMNKQKPLSKEITDDVRRYMQKRFTVCECPKCRKQVEKLKYEKVNHALHDLLLEHNVFSCYMYYCKYCMESDWVILNYF